ncbi:MAG: RHS repeat-associated core domain-containing protein [Bacteroidales bacterium]|nr:RHS repeat-associated core domain-containing protein [Bacteroidales bacterium]
MKMYFCRCKTKLLLTKTNIIMVTRWTPSTYSAVTTEYCFDGQPSRIVSRSGYDISYNYLDLPRKITGNGTTLGKYSYLSDGTLTGTIRTDGTGFVRRGLLTYRKNSDGSLTFEGADFSAGRMTCGEVIYDITDHLGSIKSVVMSGSSTPLVYNIYDAFGKESSTRLCSPSGAEPSLRWGFTGKENQDTEFGISYVDFGARQYSPALRRWMVPDPLSEKYYGISPYAYCANNPVNAIDSDGRRPVYSTQGYLLGTDDNGLQGDAIIMDPQNFHPNMNPEEALKYDLGMDGLVDSDAKSRFDDSFSSLSSRPDWDGYLTLDEANEWYRNGNGEPLYVALEKIDLSNLFSLGAHSVGTEKVTHLFFDSASINDALVYGQISLKRYPNHSVRAYADSYDFSMHNWWNPLNWPRNIATKIGKKYAGDGQDYEINIYGSKRLKPILPWIK